MIDILMLLILAVVTWCVASEGAWGAGLTFLSVLFAGLFAMNWFEPLADNLSGMRPAGRITGTSSRLLDCSPGSSSCSGF